VGIARKDGENGAQAVMQYLRDAAPGKEPAEVLETLDQHLGGLGKPVITQTELKRLVAREQQEQASRGLEDFKFASNEEMLQAMG
jgi:hypothetical protein